MFIKLTKEKIVVGAILLFLFCFPFIHYTYFGRNTLPNTTIEETNEETIPETDEVMPEDELSAGETTEPTKLEVEEKTYLGKFELTFYSKEQFPNSKTSTGVYPVVGRTVAVDPKVIPYGTSIEIDGFGVRIAEDTGGAIKGKKLDIFVETTAEALQLGRQKNVDVWLVDNK